MNWTPTRNCDKCGLHHEGGLHDCIWSLRSHAEQLRQQLLDAKWNGGLGWALFVCAGLYIFVRENVAR